MEGEGETSLNFVHAGVAEGDHVNLPNQAPDDPPYHIVISDRPRQPAAFLRWLRGGGGFISRHDSTRKRPLLKSTRNDEALLLGR
jgi:hypothetical protein